MDHGIEDVRSNFPREPNGLASRRGIVLPTMIARGTLSCCRGSIGGVDEASVNKQGPRMDAEQMHAAARSREVVPSKALREFRDCSRYL